MLIAMEENCQNLEEMLETPDFDPERLGARFWFEQYQKQREQNQQAVPRQSGQDASMVLRKLAPDVRTMVELGATTRCALCG